MLTFPRRTWDSLKMLQSVEAKLTGLGTMWGALPPFSQHLGQPHREPFLPAPAPELCTGQHTQKLVCFAKRVKGASGERTGCACTPLDSRVAGNWPNKE